MKFFKKLVRVLLPYYGEYVRFSKVKLQSNYKDFLKFKFGFNKRYWPAHKNCVIANPHKIFVGINSIVGRPGNCLQGAGKIHIGNYVRIAQNVGILSSNHDLYDHNISHKSKVTIHDYSWVGMNCIILPGVELGPRTIVAAGAVVTKSFPEGYCVIAGNPAKVIKTLDKEKFIPWTYKEEFYGFVPKEKFEESYIKKYLS